MTYKLQQMNCIKRHWNIKLKFPQDRLNQSQIKKKNEKGQNCHGWVNNRQESKFNYLNNTIGLRSKDIENKIQKYNRTNRLIQRHSGRVLSGCLHVVGTCVLL